MVTCESPTGPARRQVALEFRPVFDVAAMADFGGLSVNQARVTVVHAETDTLARRTFDFSPDSAQITARVAVALDSTETLDVLVELLSSGLLMFAGQQAMRVSATGLPTGAAPEVPLQYVGPGMQVASIRISPRDTTLAGTGTVQYGLSATDSAGQPVTQFYAAWATTGGVGTINADGLFRAGNTRGRGWVYAHTPTGIRDSTPIGVSGTVSRLQVVSGDNQTAAVGTTLPLPLVVKALASDSSAVVGASVQFGTGGGSVNPAVAPTDSLGLAATVATLGTSPGSYTITAHVGSIQAQFTATATSSAGAAIELSVPGNLVGVGASGLLLVKLTQPALSGGVTVTVTSDSTQYVTVASPGTVAFAAGDTLQSIALHGVAAGLSVLHATAPGYTAGVAGVVVTPNVIGMPAPFSMGSGLSRSVALQLIPAAPAGGLTVTVTSTDTTIVKVTTPTVTFAAGQAAGSATIQSVAPGVAALTATATGYAPGATAVTVTGNGLGFSWASQFIGAGQQDLRTNYVFTPVTVSSPLVVQLTSSDTTKVTVTDSVVIPAGSNYAYFDVTGLAPGTATLGATASGFDPASASYTVTTPAIASYANVTLNNFAHGSSFYVYSADSTGGTHAQVAPLVVSLASSDPNVVTVDSASVTIAAGQFYNYGATVVPVGVGTARILLAATGHTVLDTPVVTVQTPQLALSFGSAVLGRRQHFNGQGNGFYVTIPADRDSGIVTVTVAQRQPGVDSLSTTSVTIDASQTYYAYLEAYGLAFGADTITVSAPGYLPATGYLTVSTPALAVANLPSTAATTSPPLGTYVYAADSLGNYHYTMDTLTVEAVSSDSNVLKPDSQYYHIPRDVYYAPVSAAVIGTGTASITFSDSANGGYLPATTNTVTVTGPSLALCCGAPLTLGLRQSNGQSGSYVSTVDIVATPLVVHLTSSDTAVATVPDSVVVPAGTYYAYFPVSAKDTRAAVVIQASATGYMNATMNVQVTQPHFYLATSGQANTTSAPQSLAVYATDSTGASRFPTEDVVVSLHSTNTAVATVDSATVTIPAGQYYVSTGTWSPASVGVAQLVASDARAAAYAYLPDTATVTVVTPTLGLSWGTQTLGIGQYNNQYVQLPDNAVVPVDVTLSHGGAPRTSIVLNGTPVSTVTIDSGTYYVYFHVVGGAAGVDTLVASTATITANPDTAYTSVSLGHVNPISGWPASLSLSTSDSVLITMYAYDSAQVSHYVQDSTTFTLTPSGGIEFVSGGPNSAAITSVVIPKDSYYVQFWVKATATGSGSATISATNYAPYTTPTVTVSP
jgi:hypothetical protein